MNGSLYLMVFAVCLAANYGLSMVHAAPSSSSEQLLDSQEVPNRVVRQAPPPPPPPPSEDDFKQYKPPGMEIESFSRKRREAKGGGSMPTRKG